MLKHHKKAAGNPNRKKNYDDPERQFVIKLLRHLHDLKFSCDVIESSTYSKEHGGHGEKVTRAGFSDLVVNDSEGRSLYIECKAPSKRNTLRPDQRIFLTEKIMFNCFAICCDSVEYFDRVWAQYQMVVDRKAYLLSELPKLSAVEKRRDDSNLSFDD